MKKEKLMISSEAIPLADRAGLVSPKRMIAYQIEHEMARQGISRVEMAKQMGTSRMQLNRLLDPDNPSVTLQSIENAALVLGLQVVVSLTPRE